MKVLYGTRKHLRNGHTLSLPVFSLICINSKWRYRKNCSCLTGIICCLIDPVIAAEIVEDIKLMSMFHPLVTILYGPLQGWCHWFQPAVNFQFWHIDHLVCRQWNFFHSCEQLWENTNSLLSHDLWFEYGFGTTLGVRIVRGGKMQNRLACSMQACPASRCLWVMVDVARCMCCKYASKGLLWNNNVTPLIELENGVCKISWYGPQAQVRDAKTMLIYGINKTF